MRSIALILCLAVLLGACSLINTTRAPCQPPENFTKSDLEGVWWAGSHVDWKTDDFLIIRGDGNYKQIISLEFEDYQYEGDWLPWSLEYSEHGAIYLHLTGYRLFAFNPNFIEEDIVGGGEAWFIDYCRGPSKMHDGTNVYPGVQMPPGEGILIVRTRPPGFIQPAQGFILDLLPVSDTSSWVYEWQEPVDK